MEKLNILESENPEMDSMSMRNQVWYNQPESFEKEQL